MLGRGEGWIKERTKNMTGGPSDGVFISMGLKVNTEQNIESVLLPLYWPSIDQQMYIQAYIRRGLYTKGLPQWSTSVAADVCSGAKAGHFHASPRWDFRHSPMRLGGNGRNGALHLSPQSIGVERKAHGKQLQWCSEALLQARWLGCSPPPTFEC